MDWKNPKTWFGMIEKYSCVNPGCEFTTILDKKIFVYDYINYHTCPFTKKSKHLQEVFQGIKREYSLFLYGEEED